MKPEEIKIELFKRRRNVTMSSIARDLSCSQTAVSLVIDRKSRSARIQAAIAKAIDRPVQEVFPETL